MSRKLLATSVFVYVLKKTNENATNFYPKFLSSNGESEKISTGEDKHLPLENG